MKRLLLLVPTTSYRVGDFLAAAQRLGVDVAVGSDQPQVLESHGRTVTVDFLDLEKGVRQIVAYAGRYPLLAIVPTDEETTLLAALASRELGLAHNTPESVEAAGNKFRFRTVLANSGLTVPRFSLYSTGDDPERLADEAGYPGVLKPLAMSASRGVIRVDDRGEFIGAFRRIKGILERHGGRRDSHILAEDYVPGREVALEGLLTGGRLHVLALFDKPDPLEGPFFEETIYVTPSRLSQSEQDAVADTAATAVAALGLTSGPIHGEFRLNGRGVWVIDLAARSIGGLCARALRFGAGMRLEEIILRHALGMPGTIKEREAEAAGVMMIPIPGAGTLRRADGLISARSVTGVEDVSITIPRGQAVVPLPEGSRYLGFIFARGDTPGAVEAALREAHGRLRFTID
ncbi:MAG: ATP-grasp domain-containing protein [Proteobacteria bacterium]|nr:ATP-grasp domain-containing protein [Pseudomonadota bacterium]